MLTSLTNLTDTGVFVIETSDKHRRLASGVHLVVNGSDLKDSCSSRSDFHIDEACSALDQDTSTKSSVD